MLTIKMFWPKDNEGTFGFSCQAAACPPVYHTLWKLHTLPFNAERQVETLRNLLV